MKHFVRTTFLALALSVPAAAVLAATLEAAPVTTLNAALITTMKAGSAGDSFQSRYAALDPVVKQSFNMPVVEQNSVGFLWSTLPASQQQQLGALFEQFTVASYVSQFNRFHGEKFVLLPSEKALGDRKIVETQLIPSDGGSPVELDYVVANGAQGWQITDVLLNGTISQVAIHASDFSAMVNSGDASQLIAALKSKIAVLSSETGNQ